MVLGAAAVIAMTAGCATSENTACNRPSQNHQSVSYDPANNVTTIKNEEFTWCLRGNATNIMIYPKDSEHPVPASK